MPTAMHGSLVAQLTPFKSPPAVPSLATAVSVDQLQVPDASVPVVVTPSLASSSPTATQSVVKGQLTALKEPPPDASSATAVSVDQLQVPDTSVPVVVTPSLASSSPTATHSVVEGQLTPHNKPEPVPSLATALSADQLQVPDVSVPIVVTPSPEPSVPTATHCVVKGQLTALKAPKPVPSLATRLSVDQLHVPDVSVPVVVTPSPELSVPTATHSVGEGQLTALKEPPAVPSLATALSVDQLQVPDVSVPMVVTPSPALSSPTATHSVIKGQLTALKEPLPAPSLATGLSVDQPQVPDTSVPMVVTP
jgi:hypothetical protein